MYGEYFYNATIRKTIAIFGDMFNNISVGRKNSDGSLSNIKRVPLAYAPMQDFLERLRERPDLDENKVAIKLPRMSYEISGSLLYDAERQMGKNARCVVTDSEGNPVEIYEAAPYRIPISLHIYSKNQDEALQVVEQILPYFTPSVKRQFYWKDGETWKDEVKFILNNTSFSDEYQTDYQSNRSIVYTLEFDALINIHKRVDDNASVIKTSIVNFVNQAEEKTTTITQAVNPQSANVDDEYTIDYTRIDGFDEANE